MDAGAEGKRIRETFEGRAEKALAKLRKKLEAGKATYADVLKYASETGQEAGRVLSEELLLLYPDGIIPEADAARLLPPTLRANNALVLDAAGQVQKEKNLQEGVRLNAVLPEYNRDYEQMLIGRVAEPVKTEKFWTHTFLQSVANLAMTAVDDTVRANADFQTRSGIHRKIRRQTTGKCCKWCDALAGTYDYEDVNNAGNDVWRRHKNCDCLIEDLRDGRRSRVYNYREANTPAGRLAVERRKRIGMTGEGHRQLASSSITNLRNEWVGKSIGAKLQDYDIMDLATGKVYHLAENTYLQDKEIFAGKGKKTPYRMAYKYADKWGGKIEDWQHVKGIGVLSTPDGDRKAEIHWSQCEGIGKKDMNIKRWLE